MPWHGAPDGVYTGPPPLPYVSCYTASDSDSAASSPPRLPCVLARARRAATRAPRPSWAGWRSTRRRRAPPRSPSGRDALLPPPKRLTPSLLGQLLRLSPASTGRTKRPRRGCASAATMPARSPAWCRGIAGARSRAGGKALSHGRRRRGGGGGARRSEEERGGGERGGWRLRRRRGRRRRARRRPSRRPRRGPLARRSARPGGGAGARAGGARCKGPACDELYAREAGLVPQRRRCASRRRCGRQADRRRLDCVTSGEARDEC